MDILFQQLLFLITIVVAFFVPGALILSACSKRFEQLTSFEYVLFSFVASLSLVNFGMLIFSKIGIPLSRISLSILIFCLIALPAITLFRHRRKKSAHEKVLTDTGFSSKESWLIIIIFALTIFIKSVFLWNAILPTSTDLGHHMYWAKKIAIDQAVPEYEKINIEFENNENHLTKPEPIDDFIIGEHLPFSAIAILSGADFLSAFPSLFLFLINILTILALSALAFRVFENMFGISTARNGFIVTLLLAGPLWALSSPETKYVSGGVIGNLFGNLFIPIILLLFFRAIHTKNSTFFACAILIVGTLAFTHHLSTLVFLFIAVFICAVFFIFTKTPRSTELLPWIKLLFSPLSLSAIAILLFITLFIYTPTYLEFESVDTALGSPSKETREGLEFIQLAESVGVARFGFEMVAIAILFIFSTLRKTLGGALLAGWSIALLLMALFPAWLFLDIPSNRISTYGTFPASLLAAFAFIFLFFKKTNSSIDTQQQPLLQWTFALLLVSVVLSGFSDNASSISAGSNAKNAVQTFAVSTWLEKTTQKNEWILKDHNYIVADSWMKLFFMRDYSYPLSRGYFHRYEDETKEREQCTLLMISAPNTPDAQSCFKETSTSVIVVNPRYDSAQFTASKDFSLHYLSDDIAVYKKQEAKNR